MEAYSLARIPYAEVWVSKLEEAIKSQDIYELPKWSFLKREGNCGLFEWLQLTLFISSSHFHILFHLIFGFILTSKKR